MAIRKCRKCGLENREGAKFCADCGWRLKNNPVHLVIYLAAIAAVWQLMAREMKKWARDPSKGGASAAAAELLRAHIHLKVVQGSDDMEPVLSKAESEAFWDFKQCFMDLALDVLSKVDVKNAGESIRGELEKVGLDQGEEGEYGTVSGVALNQATKFRDLALLKFSVDLHCGADDSLYLFKENGRAWKLILAHASKNNEKPRYLQEHLKYLLFKGKAGTPVLVTIFTPPWCTSCWSVMPVMALAPSLDPYLPTRLFDKQRSVYRCSDVQLMEDGAGFSMKYTGNGKEVGELESVLESLDMSGILGKT